MENLMVGILYLTDATNICVLLSVGYRLAVC